MVMTHGRDSSPAKGFRLGASSSIISHGALGPGHEYQGNAANHGCGDLPFLTTAKSPDVSPCSRRAVFYVVGYMCLWVGATRIQLPNVIKQFYAA